ncbi:MAG: hypothetical protein NTU76_03760 [Candidatus Taylorbacteria bacterium]|nr:hypothetical protein [Candidatus Taylorbacteria bacterium]
MTEPAKNNMNIKDFAKALELHDAEERKRRKDNNEPMPKRVVNRPQQKQQQIFWFLNKLLSVSTETVREPFDGPSDYILFPVNLLGKEAPDLFPLGRYRGCGFESKDQEYYSYCNEMLKNIKKNLYKLENKVAYFNVEKFQWEEDNNDWYEGYNVVIDYDLKPLLEGYLRALVNENIKPRIVDVKDDKAKLSIKRIEVLEDRTENKRVNIYINGNYNNPRGFHRGNYWGQFYELAKKQRINFSKEFFDYFSSNKLNPLFAKSGGFKIIKILKVEDGLIVPNIEIKLITQKAITQRLKSA